MGKNDRIILLVGASGSGKTSIAKELEKDGYNIIHSYTTRKPRKENEWGHIFVSLPYKWSIYGDSSPNDDDELIAYLYYNENHYWATKEQYQGKGTSIYVVDPVGNQEVHNIVDDADVITIFLTVDKNTRMWRMIEDGRDIKDVMSRLDKDKYIFNVCKCDYIVDANGELDEVLDAIKTIIKHGRV